MYGIVWGDHMASPPSELQHCSDKAQKAETVLSAGRFYRLSKVHKTNCPGRPVMSGCNTPTEKISAFVDHQLKPLVPQIFSYVKDTNDFLKKTQRYGQVSRRNNSSHH